MDTLIINKNIMDTIIYILYSILWIEALFLVDIYLSKQDQIKPILSFQNLITLNIILIFSIIIATTF